MQRVAFAAKSSKTLTLSQPPPQQQQLPFYGGQPAPAGYNAGPRKLLFEMI